ncbi:MAG: hypothetical protein M1838_004402 [Thelocarpon superellum]|nr:MAG: hypothetical protein M1838_004402 [Thelocarpon superellum]
MADPSKDVKSKRACISCHKKKIKCDMQLPSCTQCVRSKTTCEREERPMRKRKVLLGKHLRVIEDRVKRLEETISAPVADDAPIARPKVGRDGSGMGQRRSPHQEIASAPPNAAAVPLSPRSPPQRSESAKVPISPPSTAPSTVTELSLAHVQTPTQRHLPPLRPNRLTQPLNDLFLPRGVPCMLFDGTPVTSLWSASGVQWMAAKTQDPKVQSIVETVSAFQVAAEASTEVLSPSSRRPLTPFPPEEEMRMVIAAYFLHFNTFSKLFHEPTFMQMFHQHIVNQRPASAAWIGCLNIVLAFGYRLFAVAHVKTDKHPPFPLHVGQEKVEASMENMRSLLPEIMLQPPTLLTAQALLGMAILLRATAHPPPGYALIGAAVSHLYQLGVHDAAEDARTPEDPQRRQVRLVYVLAFSLHQESFHQPDCPPFPDDVELALKLVYRELEVEAGDPLEASLQDDQAAALTRHLFSVRTQLAIIQGRARRVMEPYLAQPGVKEPVEATLKRVGELGQELEQWRWSIPSPWRPPAPIYGVAPMTHSSEMHMTILHICYFYTVMHVHHYAVACAYHDPLLAQALENEWIAGAGPAQIRASMDACLSSARSVVHVLKVIPTRPGGNGINWHTLHVAAAAFSTLSANIIRCPHALTAKADLGLLREIVHMVEKMQPIDSKIDSLTAVLQVCCIMFEMASRMIDRGFQGCSMLIENLGWEDQSSGMTGGMADCQPTSFSTASPANMAFDVPFSPNEIFPSPGTMAAQHQHQEQQGTTSHWSLPNASTGSNTDSTTNSSTPSSAHTPHAPAQTQPQSHPQCLLTPAATTHKPAPHPANELSPSAAMPMPMAMAMPMSAGSGLGQTNYEAPFPFNTAELDETVLDFFHTNYANPSLDLNL